MSGREFKTVIGKKITPPTSRGDQKACLVVISGLNLGKVYPLKQADTLIGRSEESDIVCDDPLTSRRHAQIHLDGAVVSLSDLESTNGTFVNFQRVSSVVLHNGDKLSIGQTIFKFLDADTIETAYHDELYQLSALDGLTQIYNRKKFVELLDKAMNGARRGDDQICLCMMDIDFFKHVNDTYGHQAGDYVLRAVASLVKQLVRREDVFARYGGEEFCLVLVNQLLPQARMVAEKIRQAIESYQFVFEQQEFAVSVSIGVAGFDLRMKNVDDFVRVADEKLYEAKNNGRNRVCS